MYFVVVYFVSRFVNIILRNDAVLFVTTPRLTSPVPPSVRALTSLLTGSPPLWSSPNWLWEAYGISYECPRFAASSNGGLSSIFSGHPGDLETARRCRVGHSAIPPTQGVRLRRCVLRLA